ncbi:MAG: Translin [Monoraphidium minutum]|nr:MAG: Translin [Monoraphidium minutum]
MRRQDEARETLIKRTRGGVRRRGRAGPGLGTVASCVWRGKAVRRRPPDAQKLSKQAIFSLHRGDHPQAAKQIQQAEAIARELLPLVQAQPALRFGSYAAALEEYAEAVALRVYLEERRLVARRELPLVELEEYLGGVLDMTGELNRYAVAQATKRNVAEVAACRDLVDGLMGQFLQLDFKNGGLRKKFDALKYTLRKLENTMYELSLAEAHQRRYSGGGGGGRGEGPEDDPEMQD